jgi:hypothetical protein
MAYKEQWPPLLGPGFHIYTLETLEKLTVQRFGGTTPRRNLFYKLEGLVQEFLMARVPCEFWIDGSFLTEKPEPGDIDIAIKVMDDVMETITEEQRFFLEGVSGKDVYITGLDVFIFAGYWLGHDFYGTDVDDGHSRTVPTWGQQYGKGMDDWLKGIAVLPVWENAIGLRIRS